MKVEIDAYGSMTIAPENDGETYMLGKWWQDWEACKVSLGVKVPDRNNMLAEQTIKPQPPTTEGAE